MSMVTLISATSHLREFKPHHYLLLTAACQTGL